jgi:8-oxo-dGTP diphosphatase
MTEKFIILAGVIPIYQDKILILQRSLNASFLPGHWGIPCGKLDFGETPEQAALRELHEETGLHAALSPIVATSTFTGEKAGMKLHNLQITYIGQLSSDHVVIDESSHAYAWISVTDFEHSVMDDYNKTVVRQAFQK